MDGRVSKLVNLPLLIYFFELIVFPDRFPLVTGRSCFDDEFDHVICTVFSGGHTMLAFRTLIITNSRPQDSDRSTQSKAKFAGSQSANQKRSDCHSSQHTFCHLCSL